MPEFLIKRPAAASNRMIINAALFGTAAAYLIWQGLTAGRNSFLGFGLAGVLLLLAGWALASALRPMILRLTADGAFGQAPFGDWRFDWADLDWVDFTRPNAGAVLSYRKAKGQNGAVVLSRKFTADEQLQAALDFILQQRPDVPTRNPGPWVTLGGQK